MQRTQSRTHVQTYSQVLQMKNNMNTIPRSQETDNFIEQPKKYNIDRNKGLQNRDKIGQQPVRHAERKKKYFASDLKELRMSRATQKINGRKVSKLHFVKKEQQIKLLDTSSYCISYNPESDQSESSYLSEQNTSFSNSQSSLLSKMLSYPNQVQNMRDPNIEIAQIKIQTSLGTIYFSQKIPHQHNFLSNDQNYKLTLAYDRLHSEINYAQLTEKQLKIGKIVGQYQQNKDAIAQQIENYRVLRKKSYLREGRCLLGLKNLEKNEQKNLQKCLYQLLGYCEWVKERIIELGTDKDILPRQLQKIKVNSSTSQRAVQSYPEDNNFAHKYSFSQGRFGAELTISRSDDAVVLLYEHVYGQKRIVQILRLKNLKDIFSKAWKEEVTKKVGQKIYHNVVRTISKYWFTYISDL